MASISVPPSLLTLSSWRQQRELLKTRIRTIVDNCPAGLNVPDLLRMYRAYYGCDMNYKPVGFASVTEAASAAPDVVVVRQSWGDWLICDMRCTTPPCPVGSIATSPIPHTLPRCLTPPDTEEEALPGVPYFMEVYPKDCLNLVERVFDYTLDDIKCDTLMPVVVGEVYSPSCFWLLRLDTNLQLAMKTMMNALNKYFFIEGGIERQLELGAVRVGQYCAILFNNSWYRAVIVKQLDCVTFKVLHVDYGKVQRASLSELRPLPRIFSSPSVQAIRARLAGVRPPFDALRWPLPSTQSFTQLTLNKKLTANILNIDRDERVLEVLLISPSFGNDCCISTEMTRTGHANRRLNSAIGSPDYYLLPRFEVLENGDDFNLQEFSEANYMVNAPCMLSPTCHSLPHMQMPSPGFEPVPYMTYPALNEYNQNVNVAAWLPQPHVQGPAPESVPSAYPHHLAPPHLLHHQQVHLLPHIFPNIPMISTFIPIKQFVESLSDASVRALALLSVVDPASAQRFLYWLMQCAEQSPPLN